MHCRGEVAVLKRVGGDGAWWFFFSSSSAIDTAVAHKSKVNSIISHSASLSRNQDQCRRQIFLPRKEVITLDEALIPSLISKETGCKVYRQIRTVWVRDKSEHTSI